jgi:hypothetical protein
MLTNGFFSHAIQVLVSYLADGLYDPENMESALKQAFGKDESILDLSYASQTGTRIALPVATTSNPPSRRIFSNYNGSGGHGSQGRS